MDYKYLFFDLDGTLWDFNANSEDTLLELYTHFHLDQSFEDFHSMRDLFMTVNNRLWQAYREGQIDRERLKWYRFSLLLEEAGIRDETLARELDQFYLSRSPYKTKLISGAMEVLDCLEKSYDLHIFTNGFNDVQFKKIENSGLAPFFKTVTTAEHSGHLKPDAHIFKMALDRAGATQAESIMIGDQYHVDVIGARNAGMDQIYLMSEEELPEKIESTFQIGELRGLLEIF